MSHEENECVEDECVCVEVECTCDADDEDEDEMFWDIRVMACCSRSEVVGDYRCPHTAPVSTAPHATPNIVVLVHSVCATDESRGYT